MSAYVVDTRTIREIVRHVVIMGMTRERAGEVFSLDRLAQLLLEENVKSVNYRYTEDEPAGKIPNCITTGVGGAQFVKLLHCLRYQSCEHPDFEESAASYFLDTWEGEANKRAGCELEGTAEYEAAEWGLYDIELTAKEQANQYRNLNDARGTRAPGQDRAVLAKGYTQVWYMKPEYEGDGSWGFEFCEKEGLLPDPEKLGETHTLLGTVCSEDCEQIFAALQGEFWSLNGEAKSFILKKGLGHTSMMVGDIIKVGEFVYMVDKWGFVGLPKKNRRAA